MNIFLAGIDTKNDQKIVQFADDIIDYINKENFSDELKLNYWKSISQSYFNLGDYKIALPLLNESLVLTNKIFGKYSVEYLSVLDLIRLNHHFSNDYNASIEISYQYLKICEQVLGKEHANYIVVLRNLANYYTFSGDYQKAIELNLESLNLNEKVEEKEHSSYITTLSNLAINYSYLGDYQKALELNLEVLKIKEKGLDKEHPDYLIALGLVAGNYSQLGWFQKALELNLEILKIQKKVLGKEHPNYLSALNNLASNYTDLGDNQKALELILTCLKTTEKVLGKEHRNYLISLNNLATIYSNLGNYQKALELNIEVLEIQERLFGKEHPDYLFSLRDLSVRYSNLGDYQKALELNLTCLDIQAKVLGKEHPNYLASLGDLAFLYSKLGDYQKALELNLECLKIEEKVLGKEHRNFYLFTLGCLALNYSNLGNYQKALELNIEVLEIQERVLGKEHPDYLISLSNLAFVYSNLGDYQKALELNLECLKNQEKVLGKEHPSYLTTLGILALIYSNLRNYPKALELYLSCLKTQEKVLGKEHPNYLTSLSNIASVYLNLGDFHKALEINLICLKIREKTLGKEHTNYLISLSNLSLNYSNLGDYQKTDSILDFLWFSTINNFNKNKFGLSESEINMYKSDIFHLLNYQINYSVFRHQVNPVLLTQTFTNHLNYPNLSLNIMQDLQKEVSAKKDSTLLSIFHDWKLGKKQLVFYYQKTKKELENLGVDLPKEEAKVNLLEQQLSSKLSSFPLFNKEINWQDLQKNIKKDEAFVQIVRLPFFDFEKMEWTDSLRYLAFILTTETKDNPDFIILSNGKKLENEYFDDYASSTYGKEKNTIDINSHSRYWKEIQEKVSAYKHIYVSLDGVYNKINLNTLYDTAKNEYILDQHNIHYLTTVSDFFNRDKVFSNQTKTATLIGNPDFDYIQTDSKLIDEEYLYVDNSRDITNLYMDTLQRGIKIRSLPGTKTEIENINNLLTKNNYTTSVFTEKEASEYNVKNSVSPTFLHIATHGFFFEDDSHVDSGQKKLLGFETQKVVSNPMLRSGLLFAGANKTFENIDSTQATDNGVLTAYEASFIDLKNTDLVVLSACETGSGKLINGEGVYGLRKSMKDAGAKNIIMSLWKVDDKVTQEFMTSFYEFYLNGNTIKEAFNKTQLLIKTKYPQPYYWGAFILVGE